MKNLILFLLVLLEFSATTAIAQPGFEKIYSQSGSLNLLEVNSQSLLFGIAGGQGGTGLTLIDAEGDFVQTTSYVQYPILAPATFKFNGNDTLSFVTGYISGTCQGSPRMFPVVGKMDTNGTVFSYAHYELNEACKSLAIDLEVTRDKSVITWGWQYDFFALRVDSNLNHIWSKHFNRHGHFQFIRELPGGDLLAGINMDTAGVVVARMDPAGNFLWCKSYIRPSGMVQDCIVENDSTFIITGFTDILSVGDQKLFMMKLNGTGEVQWCRGYSSIFHWNASYPERMVKTIDNSYALIATSGGRPVLMKTNTSGDTLWTRAAKAPGYSYETADLLAYSDGGFLFSGIVLGDLPDGNTGLPYIYKTDSLGHLPCSEAPPPSISISELFPVDSAFTLTSTDGATAYAELVSDTTYAPVVTYDGCLLTSVRSPVGRAMNPRIHPNPSSGHFTMAFSDPLTVDSFYSVHDATGRLLFQRPLTKSLEKVEIDLSGYGKGMYLIRFSDRDGVCAERVVVE